MLQVLLDGARGTLFEQTGDPLWRELDAAAVVSEDFNGELRVSCSEPKPVILHQLRISKSDEISPHLDFCGRCRQCPTSVSLSFSDTLPGAEDILRQLSALEESTQDEEVMIVFQQSHSAVKVAFPMIDHVIELCSNRRSHRTPRS